VKRRETGAETVTAFHEAGHAVIAAAVKVGTTRVTIVADGDSAGASHWTTALESEAHDGRFLKRLAVLMAGSISTCRAIGEPPAWTTGRGVAGYAVRTIGGRRQRIQLGSPAR
jgi:ATP-dependent Zn protease